MRVVAVLALVVAAAALVAVAAGLRTADQANRSANRAIVAINRVNAQLANVNAQLTAANTQLVGVERRANALDALCWSSRHAALPSSASFDNTGAAFDYAANVGVAIVRSIARACDDAQVPDREPKSR